MLQRLWISHKAVRHYDFVFVPDPDLCRIAACFKVANTGHEGSVTRNSSCNFFEMCGEQFLAVSVYVAGANTLHRYPLLEELPIHQTVYHLMQLWCSKELRKPIEDSVTLDL